MLLASLLLLCCGGATSTEGLHRPCPLTGCGTGQKCLTASGGGQGGQPVCEIPCAKDPECPSGFFSNVPGSRMPSRPPEVCVESDASGPR